MGKKWSAIEIERRSPMVSVEIPKDIIFTKLIASEILVVLSH